MVCERAPFDRLHPAIQHHVVNTLGWPSLRQLQEKMIPPVMDGRNVLALAPTAGGKTEAAMLPLLSRILEEDWRGPTILYVCPIKALLNNLHVRLEWLSELVGRRVGLWHGDVGQTARRRLLTDPPDVLLTTPESIESMLISSRVDAATLFGSLRCVVVDEIHAFAGDDRGWHLLAVLARVQRLSGHELQRIGLSATVGNPEEMLDWLTGTAAGDGVVVSSLAGGQENREIVLDYVGSLENAARVIAALHKGEKRLVFCDSRGRVEVLGAHLRTRGVDTYVSHSSLSLDERRRAESAFAEGTDCVIVATSTLELGIDVGDLDRVIQIDAPNTVAAFLQRLGRTGRRPGIRSNCLVLPTDEDSLLRAAGLLRLWADGYVEPIVPPPEPLHIFAQQIMALALQEGGIGRSLWPNWIGDVAAFASLERSVTDTVIEHMRATGILFEDEGILSMGVEGETQFGRRHFSDLTSVFTGEPLFRVLHGRTELGKVDPSTFAVRRRGRTVLLLGGRSWAVTHLDWPRHIAYVEPTDERGKSRWIGTPQALHGDLCRAIRTVLATGDIGVDLTQRAAGFLADTRHEYRWVKDGTTSLITEANGTERWWTFAGLHANRQLERLLGPLADSEARPTNLSVPVRPDVDPMALSRLGEGLDLNAIAVPVDEDALEGLKFSACLPHDLAAGEMSQRLANVPSLRACLDEPVRRWSESWN